MDCQGRQGYGPCLRLATPSEARCLPAQAERFAHVGGRRALCAP